MAHLETWDLRECLQIRCPTQPCPKHRSLSGTFLTPAASPPREQSLSPFTAASPRGEESLSPSTAASPPREENFPPCTVAFRSFEPGRVEWHQPARRTRQPRLALVKRGEQPLD